MSFFGGGLTLSTPLPNRRNMKERFLTLQEISNYTHTSVMFLKKLIDNGTIKAIRISKNYVVSEYEYLKFIEQMEVKTNDR